MSQQHFANRMVTGDPPAMVSARLWHESGTRHSDCCQSWKRLCSRSCPPHGPRSLPPGEGEGDAHDPARAFQDPERILFVPQTLAPVEQRAAVSARELWRRNRRIGELSPAGLERWRLAHGFAEAAGDGTLTPTALRVQVGSMLDRVWHVLDA
jgi:hypothetical protein